MKIGKCECRSGATIARWRAFGRSRPITAFVSVTCNHEFHIAERRAAMEFFRTQRMTVRREEAETEPEDQLRSAQG